ncbi:sensor histidine kinase [Paenibacillus hemerocallicola]|jgi:NarL family two-component system sensor histidine kinase LiaS|uniref:Oxygen sensor histidine kinase NreB n=1 Tax=Paenibacillus hemerocallicola TaxID=1172614 RepID=A0A5C4SVH9_9BACL|nr:sensor histidine kinase [Paenibacillus hemerocallicola]TNJ55600.1 sensor histidine kinase [Paenibacillus hemerocallicola]
MNRLTRSINIKWQLLSYFLGALAIVLGGFAIGWLYWRDTLSVNNLWIEYVLLLVGSGLVVAYLITAQLQRKIDRLHLAILQLANGNLGERIQPSGGDPFDRIYGDFNDMASSIEKRVMLLQKVGEENVMLQAKSNEDAVIEERKRLARDLHDTVSQQMFAIHMSASSLAKMVERGQTESVGPILEQLVSMSNLTQKQLRSMIAQLRPIELEGRRLSEALDKWFPDYCRQNGLQGSMDIRLAGSLSDGIEHQLFLIIQEGMANVVKHASARHVALSLHDNGNQYVLQIHDDGQGFESDTVRVNSYGLSTMRERAQKLGGNMEIRSKAGAGTRIKISIPKFEAVKERPDKSDRDRDQEQEHN